MPAYPDTSFLVSLYTSDDHSVQASGAMAKAELPLLLSPFQELELTNAIWLRLYRKQVTLRQVKSSMASFHRDIADRVYFLKPFSSIIFERGMYLAKKFSRRTGLRTLDLIHVASALEYKAPSFYTFDERQKKFAVALKLRVLP